jgi:putative ABC transport system ATP-binding protein
MLQDNYIIELKDLCKDYVDGDVVTSALAGISFGIEKGEFVAIMGPSGSGKSTLLNILSYLDRPSKGTYVFNGKKIEDLTDKDLARVRNKQMGFIFQSFNLLGRSTVFDNVEMPLLYEPDVPASERKAKVRKAVEAVGLMEKINVAANKLSGGQKQRVAIARALVNDPAVIFADEPTGNLDSASGAQVMDILSSLHRSGRTIVLVTHETYTSEFADRLLKVKDGHLELDAPITTRREGKKDFIK